MANKDSDILPAEGAHNSPYDFNELLSTMEHNYLADTLSAYMEPCEPFSLTNLEPSNNLDEPNISRTEALVYPINSTILTESSDLGDNDGKNGSKVHVIKRVSTRKSTRKISSNQKPDTKMAARKSRRTSGKKLMLDLLAVDVRRRQRSDMARRARPSAWGLGGKFDEIFKQNAEMYDSLNENIESRKGRAGRRGGMRNTDSGNQSIQSSQNGPRANNGLLVKLKLGTKAIQNCQINTIPDMDKDLESYRDVNIEETCTLQSDIKENYEKEVSRASNENLVSSKSSVFDMLLVERERNEDLAGKAGSMIHEITGLGELIENRCLDPGTSPDSEVINVIPETQVSGSTTEDIQVSLKDCISHQSGDCGAGSGIPSPEIVNEVLLCEKQIEGSWSSGTSMSIPNGVASSNASSKGGCPMEPLQQTKVGVSLDILTLDSILKTDLTVAEIESAESKPNGSKSSENKKRTNCGQKASKGKSTPKGKIKEKSGKDQADCDTETHQVTGNHDLNDFKGLQEGSRSTAEPLSNSTMVPSEGESYQGPPRSAWVCCDDCHKWRRISAILADSIESTGCRWICKDNMNKAFADCSIPQEMSNADINEELELSEASCEEDAANTRLNSSQLGQKQPTQKQPIDSPQPSWKLIKTNMFLHRTRKNQPIDEVMVCHCKPPLEGRMGCRDECLNRMLNIECVKGTCPCGESCSNQQFQKRKYSKLKCVPSGKKGFGLHLLEDIPKGRFLIEYVGEVLDMPAYEARQKEYASKGHKHFYFMTLNGSEVIDACAKGNLGRFINHSCEPNCRTEKWMVNGEVCIGLFALRDINKGEELTFDYNYVRVFGAAAKKCVCGSSRCRGVIGGDPLNDETVVLGDSDDEYPEPVTFYEKTSNKFDNILSGTQTVESISKNNNCEFYKFPMAADLEDVENSQSPDSLLVTDEKNDNPAILVESTEREASLERSSSEIKTEHTEGLLPLDTSFKANRVKSNITSRDALDHRLAEKDMKDSKKKTKSQTNLKKCTILKPKSRSKLPSPPLPAKKGKSKSMQPEIDRKPLVEPQKPKRLVVDNLTGRFDAVEEALNILLNENKGISKRRDASKGYLTLLCLTAYGGNGKGIQSNRDLSMILGALLLTKSRTVLLDVINKNGLQMLHILLKRYKKDFDKIPILRKLLKVLEYLAEMKILTLENILKPSPHRGESLKESILSLTEHANKQVHQIARNFRDRWIPRSARRVSWAERDTERMEYQPTSNFKSSPLQNTHSSDRERKSCEITDIKQPLNGHTPPVDTRTLEGSSASCPNSSTDRIRTRKRKSRWDEPGDITPYLEPSLHKSKTDNICLSSHQKQQTNGQDVDMDAPPGFSSPVNCQLPPQSHKTVMGQPQERFNSRLPTSFGVPCSVLQKIGTPECTVSNSWIVAPAMTFHPFPPLPVYPRVKEFNQPSFRYRNPNTVDRRYFKQQKWNNNSRSGHSWNPNKYGPKQSVGYGGNGFYQQSHQ